MEFEFTDDSATFVCILGDGIPDGAIARGEGLKIKVCLDGDTGKGLPEIMLKSGDWLVSLTMEPDDAATLAKALAYYAAARKRPGAQHARPELAGAAKD
jgi:hypothetical protein